ncbi:MAG: hypothetical protein LBI19_10450 [Oscillospiraceae bacterium]|nr:hypothetical protein [Oscillospiraceae bacterium]
MLHKAKKISKHLLFILYSNVIYGLIIYFSFTWLAGYSLFLAYLGNLALIALGLVWDEFNQRAMYSKKLVSQLKKESDVEKSYRFIQKIVDSFVSFKTSLYLFYIIILIVSKMLDFYPALVGENLSNFILANNYSILFLIALDTLIGQFSRDRERMQKISDHLKQSITEDRD